MEFIGLKHPNKYLKEFYNGIYLPAFPDKNERESLNTLVNALERQPAADIEVVNNPATPKSEYMKGQKVLHCVLAVDKKKPIGGIVFEFIGAKDCCLGIMWWTAVKPDYRRQCMGTKLVLAAQKILFQDVKKFGYEKLDGIFGEINNPQKMMKYGVSPETDSINPCERINFWRKNGYLRVNNFDYIQLTSNSFVKYCDLYAYPTGKFASKEISKKDLLKTVSCISSSSRKNLLGDKHFLEMIKSIKKHKGSFKLV